MSNQAVPRTLGICLLIGIAALPDAMVPIALNAAVMDRWSVSMAEAHWFSAIALVGAIGGLVLLRFLDARCKPGHLIAMASIANAGFLMLLAMPISWPLAMVARCLCGGLDIMTVAVLLGLLERGDEAHAGKRYGPATLSLLLGLALGFVLGGVLAPRVGGGVFFVSALFSILLAVAAGCGGGLLEQISTPQATKVIRVRYWPTLVFGFSDRALGAMLSVTGSLFLINELSLSETTVGTLLGILLLIMALGAWPAGFLIDRMGALPVRTMAVLGYVIGFAALAFAMEMPFWILISAMMLMGISGAGLAPATYVLAARRARGSIDMGGVQAAGSIGYFIGLVIPAAVLSWDLQFAGIFLAAATLYLLLNLPAIVAMAGWRARAAISGT